MIDGVEAMQTYSTLMLPSTFSRSTACMTLEVAPRDTSTFAPMEAPLRVIDLQKDLSHLTGLERRLRHLQLVVEAFDPAFPYAHRTDLPVHERGLSSESLAKLREGIAAVRSGEVRTVDLSELAAEDD